MQGRQCGGMESMWWRNLCGVASTEGRNVACLFTSVPNAPPQNFDSDQMHNCCTAAGVVSEPLATIFEKPRRKEGTLEVIFKREKEAPTYCRSVGLSLLLGKLQKPLNQFVST